eukprot:250500_1
MTYFLNSLIRRTTTKSLKKITSQCTIYSATMPMIMDDMKPETEEITTETQTITQIETETTLDTIDIQASPICGTDDLFFEQFDSADNNQELEEDNVAVHNLFRDNANDSMNANEPNTVHTMAPPPLQSTAASFESTQPATMGIPEPENIQQSRSHSHGVLSGNVAIDNNMIGSCSECKEAIVASDWTKNNVQQIKDGTMKHLVCPSTCDLFVDKYVSDTIMNEALMMGVMHRLHRKQSASVELLHEVSHLVDPKTYELDIIKDCDFVMTDWTKVGMDMESVVIMNVKRKEKVLMHCNDEKEVIVYDSHPRGQLKGSHFLIFNEKQKADLYVQQLWPKDCNQCHLTQYRLQDKECKQEDDDDDGAIDLEKLDAKTKQYVEKLLDKISKLEDEVEQLKLQKK